LFGNTNAPLISEKISATIMVPEVKASAKVDAAPNLFGQSVDTTAHLKT
jgi:hypothetical protein